MVRDDFQVRTEEVDGTETVQNFTEFSVALAAYQRTVVERRQEGEWCACELILVLCQDTVKGWEAHDGHVD